MRFIGGERRCRDMVQDARLRCRRLSGDLGGFFRRPYFGGSGIRGGGRKVSYGLFFPVIRGVVVVVVVAAAAAAAVVVISTTIKALSFSLPLSRSLSLCMCSCTRASTFY